MEKCTDLFRPNTLLATSVTISYDFFPNIHNLLTILATLPVTTAIAEYSISTLRWLKTYLRNNVGEQRPTELALINIYQNNKINIEEVINKFARLDAN